MAQRVTINEALVQSNWDNLPDTSFVRLPVVRGLLGGISAATVWRLVKAQKLKTYKLTPRTTTFKVGELRTLLATKGV
jgi:predicted DNA-binding transcriptional regulator AlpA